MTFDETDMYSGLAALHWSAYDDPAWDHDFYKRIVEQSGGLALDVACGAGRLLRRYLQAGLAVEGVDSAADMLAVCRQKAEAEGLSPVLYCQPMQALDLPKRYACIYVPCGSFTCVIGQENALEALRRFHRHLLPGGVLAFNAYFGDWGDYDYNKPEQERVYPSEWKPHVVKSSAASGAWLWSAAGPAWIPSSRSSANSDAIGCTTASSCCKRKFTPARTTGTSRRRCC